MKTWAKSVFVVSCAMALNVSNGLSGVARPGEGDTQMQVQVDELTVKIKANPRDFDSIFKRGMLLRQLLRLDQCESDGKTLIKLNPSSPYGYWLLSRVARDRKDSANGLKWIRESIAREKPDIDHFHYELSCLNDLNRYTELISRSEQVEKLFPRDGRNFYLRALARYNANQDKQLVIRDLDLASKYASGDPGLAKSISKVYKSL